MKALRFLVPALLLFCTSCGEEVSEQSTATSVAKEVIANDNTTPEGTARLITTHVIANDYNSIANMIITADEMTKAISGSTAPAEGKKFAMSRVDEEIKEMQVDIKAGLDEIRATGTTAGIVWENCKFKEARPTIDEKRGFSMMLLKCVMDCNGQEYIFTVTDIVQTDAGWKLAGTMMFGDAALQ